jgi:hypothetical protein
MVVPANIKAHGKLFDVHFEIGTLSSGDFYARTMLGASLIMEQPGTSPAIAIAKLAAEMETTNMWGILAQNPAMSSYPFGTAAAKPIPPAKKPDPNVVRKKPMELTQVAHPDCQMLCTSFDFFGKTKCRSMCGQRTGL